MSCRSSTSPKSCTSVGEGNDEIERGDVVEAFDNVGDDGPEMDRLVVQVDGSSVLAMSSSFSVLKNTETSNSESFEWTEAGSCSHRGVSQSKTPC